METRHTFVNDYRKQKSYPIHYVFTARKTGYRKEVDFFRQGKPGMLHTVHCSRGGKFIPGEVKLRAFSASRETVLYGEDGHLVVNVGSSPALPPGQDDGWVEEWHGALGLYSIGPLGSGVSPISVPPNLGDIALTKAKAKFHASGEDLGQFIAELPESVRTVLTMTREVMRVVRNLRKEGFSWKRCDQARRLLRSGKTIKSLPRKLSHAWLLWRYGVRPLYWDMLMVIRVINEKYNFSKDTGLLRKSATETFEQQHEYVVVRSTAHDKYDYRVQMEARVKARATIYYRKLAGVSLHSEILRYYGLHPEQFPALLWEITPLSFVMDWFINVGEWIKAITPRADVRIEGFSISTKTSLSKTRTGIKNTFKSSSIRSTTYDAAYPTDTYRLDSLVRTVGNSLSDLQIALKPQVLLSVQQKLDLLALAFQRMSANRRRS